MKSFKFILAVSIISIFIQSCRKGILWGITGKGSNITEVRAASGYNSIQLSIDADVSYTQDSVYYLEISAQPNIMKVLATEVNGSELKIDFKRNVWKHHTVKITVHSPNMNKLGISGSGDIAVSNAIKTSDMSLSISGSGDISIPSLIAETLTAKISGSGNITVSDGKINSEELSISGSGNIKTDNAVCNNNTSKISGSGDISLYATENLNISISGSGDIRYRGQPAVSSKISGSGSLIHIN